MENSNFNLAEMANTADYAAMNYGELLETSLAFTMALGLQIKPLLEKKRLDEMAKITHIFMTAINAYDATRSEILTLLEAEGMKETRMFTHTQDVDDQTTDEPNNATPCDHQDDKPILALPEHIEQDVTVVEESSDVEKRPAEEEPESNETVCTEANNETFVEEAVGILRTLKIPDNVDPSEPYYMECDFGYEGELGHSDPSGRNMSRKDLEEFRSASEAYFRILKKKNIIASTEDCLAYSEGLNTFMVRLYHFPEDMGSTIDTPAQEPTLSANEMKALKKKKSYLKEAIKLAKEYSYSGGTDVDKPFYDEYVFSLNYGNKYDLKTDRVRVYEDTDNLVELMPAFESYAKLFHEGYTVVAKDNCVAALQYKTIYVVLFNIPAQEKKTVEHVSKRRGRPKKSAPTANEAPVSEESAVVTSTSTTQTEDDLIQKAVDLTRNLPLAKGTDANSTYYLQSSFSVTNDGNLIYSGRPFSRNVSIDDLDRCMHTHQKYARTMKASHILSTDEYTAFISNDGKTVTVFDYKR